MSRDNFGRPIGAISVNVQEGTIDILTAGQPPNQYVLPSTFSGSEPGMVMSVGNTNQLGFTRLDHSDLSNHGNYTHQQIDTFIDTHGGPGDGDVMFNSVQVETTLEVKGASTLDSAEVKTLSVGTMVPIVDPPGVDSYTFPPSNPFVANRMLLTDGSHNLQFAPFDHATIANRGTVSHADLDILHSKVDQAVKVDSDVHFKSLTLTDPLTHEEVHTDNLTTKQIEHKNADDDVKFQTFVNNANDLVTQVKDNANTALTIYSGVSKIQTLAAQVEIVASSARIASAAFSITKGSIELGHELEDYKNASMVMSRKSGDDEAVITFKDFDGDPATAVRVGQFPGSSKLRIKNNVHDLMTIDPDTNVVGIDHKMTAPQITVRDQVEGDMYSMVLTGGNSEQLELTYHGTVPGTTTQHLTFDPIIANSSISSTYQLLNIPRTITVGDEAQSQASINCRRHDAVGTTSKFTLGTTQEPYVPDWVIAQKPYPVTDLIVSGSSRIDPALEIASNYSTKFRTDNFRVQGTVEDSGNADVYLVNQGPTKRARLTFTDDLSNGAFHQQYETSVNKLVTRDDSVIYHECQPDGLTGNFQVFSKFNSAGPTGDLLVGNAGAMARLPIGAANQVLTVSGGTAVWQTHQKATFILPFGATLSANMLTRYMAVNGQANTGSQSTIDEIVSVSVPVDCKLIKASYSTASNDATTRLEVYKNGGPVAVSVLECTADTTHSVTPTVEAMFASGDSVEVGHPPSITTGGTNPGNTTVHLLFEVV